MVADFFGCGSGRSNLQFFYLAHILCSYMRQYECDDVLDGFWGPGNGCWLDHGQIQVAKQCQDNFFASINFRGPGFIRKYSENLYTAKISTYNMVLCSPVLARSCYLRC